MTTAPPSADDVEFFLEELAILYHKHRLRLASREEIVVVPTSPIVTEARVVARFEDPETGPDEEFGGHLYERLSDAWYSVESIRNASRLSPPRYVLW